MGVMGIQNHIFPLGYPAKAPLSGIKSDVLLRGVGDRFGEGRKRRNADPLRAGFEILNVDILPVGFPFSLLYRHQRGILHHGVYPVADLIPSHWQIIRLMLSEKRKRFPKQRMYRFIHSGMIQVIQNHPSLSFRFHQMDSP